MSVDTYAICPCGSGKKIKFCHKCADSVGDLDRVLTMVEGGQVVPALDRLSQILQDHPDAAWALAIRGRLLLDLREYESLTDNAERFIRLQPSNPLALTQRAAALLFQNKREEATETLLEALTESGKDVDAFVLDIASVLGFSLAQAGFFLTARLYSTLAMMAPGYEGGRSAVQVLRELNQSQSLSQLLKTVPHEISRPADVDWAERYDEAAGLLRSNKIVLAQSKFESLQRSHAGQPAVLSGLLICAVWRGDVDAQSSLMKKLSECESLDFEERARYLAMSALIKTSMPDLSVETVQLKSDIDKADEVELALTADERMVALPPEMVANMRTSPDDVPPRSGFQVIDRDKPESLDQLPPVGEVPESLATVLLYGKQTDREARIEVLDVRAGDSDEVKQRLSGLIGDHELTQEAGDPMPLVIACQPPVAMLRFQAKPAEAEKLQSNLTLARMPEIIVNSKMGILGGKSLAETAGDDSLLLERTAMVRVVEQYDSILSKGDSVIDAVYKASGIDPLPAIKPAKEEIETLGNEDLHRIDPSELDAESLVYIIQRAQQISSTRALRTCSERLLEMELSDEEKPAKMVAYVSLVNTATNNEQALAKLDEAKAYAEQYDIPIPSLLLSEISLRVSAGDAEGFQRAVETLGTRHGNEPEIMAQLQQILMAYGFINPDGSPRTAPGGPPTAAAPAGAAQQGGGLWTPDSGAPPASDGGQGGGKLWVPGMD